MNSSSTDVASSPPLASFLNRPHSHGFWVVLLLAVCVLWSMAGVVIRTLQSAKTWEVTFWRSLFAALVMAIIVVAQKRGSAVQYVRAMGWPGVVSGLMFCGMFTCFMLALTLTSTANAFVANSLYPIFAGLLAWAVLGSRPPNRIWVATFAAIVGLGYMVWAGVGGGALGTFIALGVPICAAINLVVIKRFAKEVDLVPAVMLGGLFSALITLPFALPFKATVYDVSALAFLGAFQLAIPCAISVVIARHLQPAEIALISLTEALMGPLWAWLGVGETPERATLIGGGIAFVAIAINEALAFRESRTGRLRPD